MSADDLGPPPESAHLLPCPFCGGHARPSSRNGLTFFIECQTSYCAIVGPERCAADAVSAWNRRAALTINPDDPKQVAAVMAQIESVCTDSNSDKRVARDVLAALKALSDARENENA